MDLFFGILFSFQSPIGNTAYLPGHVPPQVTRRKPADVGEAIHTFRETARTNSSKGKRKKKGIIQKEDSIDLDPCDLPSKIKTTITITAKNDRN